jgi:putative phosphoribosyl transferase
MDEQELWTQRQPEPQFENRAAAGEELAGRLKRYRDHDTLVLGIPAGGLEVARAVAASLGAELDVMVVVKLSAPATAELSIGTVTANASRYLNESIIREIGLPDSFIAAETSRRQAEAAERETQIRGCRAPARLHDRVVILVDDGTATGATLRAALRAIRRNQPARIVAAVPIAAQQALDVLLPEADEIVCLRTPFPFRRVAQLYQDAEAPPAGAVDLLQQYRRSSQRAAAR